MHDINFEFISFKKTIKCLSFIINTHCVMITVTKGFFYKLLKNSLKSKRLEIAIYNQIKVNFNWLIQKKIFYSNKKMTVAI